MTAPSYAVTLAFDAHTVVTDVTVSSEPLSACQLDPQKWLRIEKDLNLYTAKQRAWLYVELAKEEALTSHDLVVMDIRTELPSEENNSWESRPAGIWVKRSKHTGTVDKAVTEVDVLFGADAIDPRPHWSLLQSPLRLNTQPKVPAAKLTVLHGRSKPKSDDHRTALRFREDGKFKIVQISDTHMVTGVGSCKDSLDADGKFLPESEADPRTVDFLGEILDVEKPDLVVFTGDQLHHDIPDSQSAIFKVVAPVIERSIPFAAVFGNHDSEGEFALSRSAQMSILQDLPFSLCESGPKDVDGVGNYYHHILAPAPSQYSSSTLYLLDSHGQIKSKIHNPDYDPIKQSQIDWFKNVSQSQRTTREKDKDFNRFHLSLAFLHIPIPEYGDRNLKTWAGQRREPTEGPSLNSHFYDALVEEGISALACGHDHVNDFCALLPRKKALSQNGNEAPHLGPWLCYGGGSGFGGYCSYGRKRFHRRSRIWEIDMNGGAIKTWKRLEYSKNRVDELVLVQHGSVIEPPCEKEEDARCVMS